MFYYIGYYLIYLYPVKRAVHLHKYSAAVFLTVQALTYKYEDGILSLQQFLSSLESPSFRFLSYTVREGWEL